MHNKYLTISFYILWIINTLLIIQEWFLRALRYQQELTSWGFSEFLINYQGGVVRRGLFGELLYMFCLHFSYSPKFIVIPICYLSFITFLCIIYYITKKLQLSYLAIPTLYCLFGGDLIRKDYLILVLIFFSILLFQKIKTSGLRLPITASVLFLALNLHEATFFIAAPLFFLVVFSDSDTRISLKEKIAYSLFLISVMALLCLAKGDKSTAEAIFFSWQQLYPDNFVQFNTGNSIGSLSWETGGTFKTHAFRNFIVGYIPYIGLLLRPLSIFIIFYLMVQVTLRQYRHKRQTLVNKYIYITTFQFFALLPMFTVLSCDFRRVCFYWVSASLFSLYIMKDKKVTWMDTSFVQNIIDLANKIFKIKIYKPIPFILLLSFSVPYYNNPPSEYCSPIIKKTAQMLKATIL